MAVKVCVFFRPKNFSNIGAQSYIYILRWRHQQKNTKKGPFWWRHQQKHKKKGLLFWWRHHKKSIFWWRHNHKLHTPFSQFLLPFKKWKFGNYHFTTRTFKRYTYFTFSNFKICDTSWCWETPNRVLKYKM